MATPAKSCNRVRARLGVVSPAIAMVVLLHRVNVVFDGALHSFGMVANAWRKRLDR